MKRSSSFYTKKFFARGTEFFYKQPCIEARWDSATKDDARNFYLSSSLATATDNLNTLYLYNYVRGQLKNIPDCWYWGHPFIERCTKPLGAPRLRFPGGSGVVTTDDTNVTGGYVKTGVYSASLAHIQVRQQPFIQCGMLMPTRLRVTAATEYHTGSAITVKTLLGSNINPNPKYVTNITNLKSKYDNDEVARFRLYARQKDWNPTIYTKATSVIQGEIIESGYYKVVRVVDEFEVIPYGTGSDNHTQVSFDASGSYFDLEMSLLETGYAYGIKLVYNINGAYHEQPEVFKFRVE